ncbi:MAG: hypothetical protein M3Z98_08720, partial [Candidatus Dormibacteraeota bacterium]|nr:hypothetical protein [Candidatus Dormibacteraeota bacterium]
MATTDLERRLHELGAEMVYPATPDLARAIRARIRPQPAWRRWRVALAAAAVVLIALAGVVAVNPEARRVVAGFLGLPGLQFQKVKVLPSPSPPLNPNSRAVSLDEARRLAGFPVLTPGPPEEIRSVRFDGGPPGGEVELDLAGGAVITEVKGAIEKGIFAKMIAADGKVTEVDVNGNTGYWVTGGEHVFVYIDADGVYHTEG